MFYEQSSYDVCCEWGLVGVSVFAPLCEAVAIVDVLSFTTSVDVAVSRGARVYPFRWQDERATTFAAKRDALLASRHRQSGDEYTLSPSSLRHIPAGTRLVLPSPNGSTLSLGTGTTPTFAGCLRNASAVARGLAQIGRRIAVIPAGERWPNGSLRPAVEDLVGAGAIIHALPGSRSPEAATAEAVFLHHRAQLDVTLRASSSGRELIERGFADDVELAGELDVSTCAPRLVDGAYG